jgi:hypothetical protein
VSRHRHGEIIAAGDLLHDAVAVGVSAVDAVSEMSLGDVMLGSLDGPRL